MSRTKHANPEKHRSNRNRIFALALALLLFPGFGSAQEAETGEFDFPSRTVLLNSGYRMPVIGLGTWTLSDDEAGNSVYHALKSGMRLIDTARYYGNETGVGRGLRRAVDEGIVTREEVFITSKIYGGSYEQAGSIIDNALSDLGVDYIDLLLIHQPGADDEGVYKAMEDAVRDGRLRSIGISNYYTPEAVDKVLSFATIVPAVIQNENHLYYQNTVLQEYVEDVTNPSSKNFIKKEDRGYLGAGTLAGMITIPIGCIAGGLVMNMTPYKIGIVRILQNLIPVIIVAGLIVAGLWFIPAKMINGFNVFGNWVTIVITFFTAIAVFEYQTGIEFPLMSIMVEPDAD